MSKNKIAPTYIDKKPQDKDFFKGPHQKVADTIVQLIRQSSESIDNKIVGLEGNWGSGKSTVINLITKEVVNKETHEVFIFDAWGHQEDLTRKSFLTELITFLSPKYLEKEKWKKKKNELHANKFSSYTKTFPQIKPHAILFVIASLLIPIFSEFFEQVVSKRDWYPNVEFPIWFPYIITTFTIPTLIYFWAIRKTWQEFKKIKKNTGNKDRPKWYLSWKFFSHVFYWFNGSNIESTRSENIIENEPTVAQFREYFLEIEGDLKKKKKKLIVVFDNLDRLSKEKLESLWSSIHTFFAEGTNTANSWILIPYNKVEVDKTLGNTDSNGFLDKSIHINFRVTPPIVSAWQEFMKVKTQEAFGNLINESDIKEWIIKLYMLFNSKNQITPREMISYINDLVSLYLQWENKVHIRYLALFVLNKRKFTGEVSCYDTLRKEKQSISEIILDKTQYCKNAGGLFENDEMIFTHMAALVFGVEVKKADEVLLNQNITTALLKDGGVEKIKPYIKHSAFSLYFNKAYHGLNLSDKIDHLSNILNHIDKEANIDTREYWQDFAIKLSERDDEKYTFDSNHITLLDKIDENISMKLISGFVDKCKYNIPNTVGEFDYYKQIKLIEKSIVESDVIDYKLKDFQETKIGFSNFDEFLEMVSEELADYDNYGFVDFEEFENSMRNEQGEKYDINIIIKNPKAFTVLKDRHKFSDVKEYAKSQINPLTHGNEEELDNLIKILTILKTESTLKLEISNNLLSYLNNDSLEEYESYVDALCIAISKFNDSWQKNTNFRKNMQNLNDENIDKVSSKIQSYYSFQGLLDLLCENQNARSVKCIRVLVNNIIDKKHSKTSRLNIDKTLKEYNTIEDLVFENDEELIQKFVIRINNWSESIELPFNEIHYKFYKNIVKNQDLKLVQIITSKALDYYNQLDQETLLVALEKEDKNHSLLKTLCDINKLEITNSLYLAINSFYQEIFRRKYDLKVIDIEFLGVLTNLLSKGQLKPVFFEGKDILFKQHSELKEIEIQTFTDQLIEFGQLEKDNDRTCSLIISPILNNENIYYLFDKHYQTFKKIALQSEKVISQLQVMLENGTLDKFKKKESVIKDFNLKKKEDEEVETT